VIDAVECAISIQETLGKLSADVEAARRMLYRIGINLGDVMYDDSRIYGDGVNVAARLEAIAEHGGVSYLRISEKVQQEISRRQLRGPGRATAQEHRL
jgi:class 3 adenylate cyclase